MTLKRVVVAAVVLVLATGNVLSAAAITITTPPNGLSAPYVTANPVNGTGNPNGTPVTGSIFFKAPGGAYTLIDTLWTTSINSGGWTTSASSGNNGYSAKGSYKYTAQLSMYPGVSATNICTIP